MVKIVVTIEEEVVDGIAALLKMKAKGDERKMLDDATKAVKEAESVEVSIDAFEEQKDEVAMALASLALMNKMQELEK